ncbi:MAG: DNA-processing protein DprA [Clostridia bacterium]|nr:DNA-processing protein DprA [Clostridia bacterium]
MMFNDEELALIWFDYNDIKFAKVEQILEVFDKISDIFNKNLVKSAIFKNKLFDEIKNLMLEIDYEEFKERVLDEFYKYNILAVTFASKKYPEKLKNIENPPLVIYARGDISLLNKKSISIVGTRKPTTYGKIVTEKFTKELSSAGLVTVSGLAYGIDTCVANATLAAGGKTIAVLAGGLDSIYPSQNKGLADKIVESGGLLISENRVTIKPVQYSFIERNRIVSGLGLGTLIVEAGKTSGTMATARHALEQGRELFVVPGNIYSPESEGTNTLIDEMPDTFTICPERILYRLNIKKKETKKTEVQVDMIEGDILDVLSNGELSFDELADKTGLKPSELSAKLIKLEMFGLVKKGPSNTYYKI